MKAKRGDRRRARSNVLNALAYYTKKRPTLEREVIQRHAERLIQSGGATGLTTESLGLIEDLLDLLMGQDGVGARTVLAMGHR